MHSSATSSVAPAIDYLDSDPEFRRQLASAFAADAISSLGEMEVFLERNEMWLVARVAHRFQSSLFAVGADTSGLRARELECAAINREPQHIRRLLAELRVDVRIIQQNL